MATSTLPKEKMTARRSTVFLKLMMAASGALFVLYVIMHMYGNLKMFGGQTAFDEYAHHLRTMLMPILPFGGFLWLFRALLLVALIAHAYSAFTLWARAKGARPNRYVAKEAGRAALRTKMMRWGGVTLLLFLVWHLCEFTWFKFNVNSDVSDAQIGDSPYNLVHASFKVWWVVLIYALAMIALGLHLFHGVWSAAQTCGWTSTRKSRAMWKGIGHLVATVVVVGFLLPPLCILFGIIK